MGEGNDAINHIVVEGSTDLATRDFRDIGGLEGELRLNQGRHMFRGGMLVCPRAETEVEKGRRVRDVVGVMLSSSKASAQ